MYFVMLCLMNVLKDFFSVDDVFVVFEMLCGFF